MDSIDKQKEILLAALRGVADDLARGNDKSKRMARILDIAGNIFRTSEAKFDRVWSELYEVYFEMSKVHNKMYQAVGGHMGTGEFIGMDIEEAESKSGIALGKLLEGIDPEGYMKLQVGIGQIRNLLAASANMPFPSPAAKVIAKTENIYWLSLMSVYEYSHQERVLKILRKYDSKVS